MYTCIICHFSATLDDAVISGRNGRCICLRCYLRETESDRPMTKELRRDLSLALSGIAGMD
jgi:hypothetical protein